MKRKKTKKNTSANVEVKKEFQQASCPAVNGEAQPSRWGEWDRWTEQAEGIKIKTYKMIS